MLLIEAYIYNYVLGCFDITVSSIALSEEAL